jgi:uncharacterized membrane protein SpoIIM required for sporulation
MRESRFLKQNAEKWKQYEQELNANIPTDTVANRFVELTDDLAYARTFYPKSNTEKYLNGLASVFHQKIYRNKKEKKGRIFWFWQYELPFLFKQYHNLNIENGDPFGVYKQANSLLMFLGIAYNNISVSFLGFVLGIFFSIGTVWLLFSNGVMMGSFQYYFISKGLGTKFILVVFIHGTLELWSIIIAGASGLILGNSILFPGTYTRTASFLKGGKDGLKIVIGLIPLFITAAFFEGFVTRHTEMPPVVSLLILLASLAFIIWYFIIYPIQLHKRMEAINKNELPETDNKNFSAWLSKKFSSEK